ncbi:hypothetical protein AVEN_160999-1 [Araneus ventricosus]|uniref:CMP domain-containing protein n=1 Tax=Araneus ventricosus TaxID=182803 RepID=A0A4Y2FY69_ARAVE|nr:hypothetical protein AVEN_160999-1 [Araneus ventricosus]
MNMSNLSKLVRRSIPVHCIVEQVTPQGQSVNLSQAAVDQDSFAIIPSNALFSEIVHTALSKLGYSSSAALTAKGELCSVLVVLFCGTAWLLLHKTQSTNKLVVGEKTRYLEYKRVSNHRTVGVF